MFFPPTYPRELAGAKTSPRNERTGDEFEGLGNALVVRHFGQICEWFGWEFKGTGAVQWQMGIDEGGT